MRSQALMNAIWGLVGLVVILLAVVLWFVPASTRLNDELAHARGEIPRHRTQLESLVGPSYEDDLRKAIEDGRKQIESLEDELTRQARELERWFPHAEKASDVPARDRFASAYTFHQDELRRLLTEVANIKRRKLDEVPLVQPRFLAEGRQPKDVEEMRAAQRVANLEALLLQAAARADGFPIRPIEFQEGWRTVGVDSPFQESSVVVHLSLPAPSLHGLLRALCELKGEGPIVRLEQLSTRPAPLPARLEPEEAPLIEADVRLVVSTYRKK